MRRPDAEKGILRQLDDAIRQPRAAKLLAAIADDVDQSLELIKQGEKAKRFTP